VLVLNTNRMANVVTLVPRDRLASAVASPNVTCSGCRPSR
jgi:hypothetical protein